MTNQVEVLVIGSGAGGAVTAAVLAEQGFEVVVLEEGPRLAKANYGASSPDALGRFYRRRGMTPIVGPTPIGFAEGACVGGSTEVNSGFWQRTPPDVVRAWAREYQADISPEALSEHYLWAEQVLGVAASGGPLPPSSDVLRRGAETLGWQAGETPRSAPGCAQTNTCPGGCPTGAKQGMSQRLLPMAEAKGARILAGCRVLQLIRSSDRVTGVLAQLGQPDGAIETIRINARHVFVCCGATQTPALLRRSGLRLNVGNSLRVHPMLKVAARFDRPVNAATSVMPLVQVREFQPDVTLGGAFFTPGHLAMLLSENWPQNRHQMDRADHIANYYVAVRGSGRGSVRPSIWRGGGTVVRYELSRRDLTNLSRGLAHLSTLLLEAGANEVVPAVHGLGPITSRGASAEWMDRCLPRRRLSLTTVHAFSSCPMGERPDRCAVDSYGRSRLAKNLYLNDASVLPDSPGVNPQGTIMAIAHRNALHFAEEAR